MRILLINLMEPLLQQLTTKLTVHNVKTKNYEEDINTIN